MDDDGYLRLTDFGLAKMVEEDELTYTYCGTPEYLPPEILREEGHSFTMDWWGLGILTYELICGFPPFYTGNDDYSHMFKLI